MTTTQDCKKQTVINGIGLGLVVYQAFFDFQRIISSSGAIIGFAQERGHPVAGLWTND